MNNLPNRKGVPRNMKFGPFKNGIPKGNWNVEKDQWRPIVNYVISEVGIKKSICVGCGKGRLYDNNGTAYDINRKMTLDTVKGIVATIKEKNSN